MYLKANPLCVVCAAVANEVDHVMPINAGGARLSVNNMQSLCKPCHSRKTAIDVLMYGLGAGRP